MITIQEYKILSECKAREYLEYFHLSKSKIYNLFFNKQITRNNEIIKENDILHVNDIINISYDEEIDFLCEDYDLDIIYEDDYLLIINKPSSIIIHDDDKSKPHTLANYVAGYYKKNNINYTIKYAHRLDFETTGIIIFCKDMLTHSYMNYYISTHDIKRSYIAFVSGFIKAKEGIISIGIADDRHNSKRKRASSNGKEAITNYKVLEEYKNYSKVIAQLQTGRTHQIRVHFSYLGNPLLGDTLYNGDNKLIKRVALHSYKVNFIHPITKENIEIICPLPADMLKLEK